MDLQQTQQNLVELKDKAVASASATAQSVSDTASTYTQQLMAAADSAKQSIADAAVTQQMLAAADSAKTAVAESAVTKQLLSAVDSAKQTVAESTVGQKVAAAADSAKHFVATEMDTAAGYKDQLMGAAKERIGEMMGDADMKSAGLQQQREGRTQVKTAGATADELAHDERAQVTDQLIKRHALVAEVERLGGADGAELKHVDAPHDEVNVAALAKDLGQLKTFDKEPLISSIQQGADLKHVETTEKGLLVTLPLNDTEIKHLKESALTSPRNAVLDEIKQSGSDQLAAKLSTVEDGSISDRSEPRLDTVLKTVGAAQAQRGELVRQIGSGAAADEASLKHTTTDDKSKPALDLPSLNQKPVDKAALLSEVQQGADLKHVQ